MGIHPDHHSKADRVRLIELGQWRPDTTLTPEETYIWLSQGSPWTADAIAEWSATFTMSEALEWAPHPTRPGKLMPYRKIIHWKRSGRSKSELAEWVAALGDGAFDLHRASAWKQYGFTAAEANEWARHVPLPARAQAYRDRLLSPADARLYERSGGLTIMSMLTIAQARQVAESGACADLAIKNDFRRWMTLASNSLRPGDDREQIAQRIIDEMLLGPGRQSGK